MTEAALVRQEVLPMNLLVVDDEQYVWQLLRGGSEWHESHPRSLNSRFLQITGLQASDAADLVDLDALISKLSRRIVGPWNFAQRWRNLARGIDGGIREELELVGPSARIVQRMSRPIVDGSGRRQGRLEIYLDLTGRRGFQTKLLRTEKLAALGQFDYWHRS